MAETPKTKKFGIDSKTHHLILGSWRVPMPKSRLPRIALGGALVCGGVLGFLPILGFWMVPLGLVVLSQDIAFVRRRRRRITVWWGRRKRPAVREPRGFRPTVHPIEPGTPHSSPSDSR